MAEPTTQVRTASDGAGVAVHETGEGRDLVIVHGSIATAQDWLGVAGLLADGHRSHVLDRRGRGGSGDNDDYTLATEAGDIRLVLDEAGPDAALIGHSYGAICALEAVRLGATPSALVLYEPPLPVDGLIAGEHWQPYADAIAAGDNEQAMIIACDHFLRVSEQEKEMIRSSPLWPGFLALAPTWTRELAEIDLTVDRVDEYAALTVPTLLLVGSDSPSHLVGATRWLAERMPNVEVVSLEGQGHLANLLVPELVADAVRAFLSRH